MKKQLVLVMAVLACSACAYSQTLAADQEGSETKIVFSMKNEKSADIFRVNSVSFGTSSTIYVGSSGYVGSAMGTSNGTNVSYVCSTPAELTLDKGQIQLQVGTGYTAKKFNISATGGTQEWEIRPGSDGKFAAA